MAMFEIHTVDEQIKALPTVDTASGAIATFDTDMTENLVEVKCQIVAQQASGTPSPDNPLPITTYTEMNVWAYNDTVQYLDSTTESATNNGLTCSYIGGGKYRVTGTMTVSQETVLSFPVNSFVIYGGADSTIAFNNTVSHPNLKLVLRNGSTTVESWNMNAVKRVSTYTGMRNKTVDNFQLSVPTGFYGSPVDFTFQPYMYGSDNMTTANIPFGQTVANGVLDITTGKLRVTMSQPVDLGDYTWINEGNGQARVSIIQSTYLFIGDVICDSYQGINSITLTDNTIAITNSQLYPIIRVKDTVNIPDSASASDIKTFMTGKKACFELETPIEIQLDSITLQALLNENNIWCDTGDTEVKFLLTVGKKIS